MFSRIQVQIKNKRKPREERKTLHANLANPVSPCHSGEDLEFLQNKKMNIDETLMNFFFSLNKADGRVYWSILSIMFCHCHCPLVSVTDSKTAIVIGNFLFHLYIEQSMYVLGLYFSEKRHILV
jgi:hypothetical protein